MENSGLISVIIPVYNVEKYLEECINSVLSQTYKGFEIILVDDGSTDSSGAICDEYEKKYECVKVCHKQNGGLSAARNVGLSLALGEYIYFLDSDDYIVNNAFEKLVTAMQSEKADFVFFDALSFEEGARNFNIKQNYTRKREYIPGNGLDVLSQLIGNNDYHSAIPLNIYNRSFLTANDLSFLKDIVYEDILFSYKAFCLAVRVAHINSQLYYRRYRSDSIMTSAKGKKHFDSICQVYKECLDFSLNQSLEKNEVSKKYLSRCAFNVFNNYEKLSKEDKINCKKSLLNVKNDILQNNAFGNKALEMRCYGKAVWFVYKVFEKTLGRLFI